MPLNVLRNGSLETMNEAIFNTRQYKSLLAWIDREYLELDEIPQHLGPNWEAVLNWWFYCEQLPPEDGIRTCLCNLMLYSYSSEHYVRIKKNIWDTCERIIGGEPYTIYMTAFSPEYFTLELVAMHEILNSGGELHFIPLLEKL